jgi:hypothetical protein
MINLFSLKNYLDCFLAGDSKSEACKRRFERIAAMGIFLFFCDRGVWRVVSYIRDVDKIDESN